MKDRETYAPRESERERERETETERHTDIVIPTHKLLHTKNKQEYSGVGW